MLENKGKSDGTNIDIELTLKGMFFSKIIEPTKNGLIDKLRNRDYET